MSAGETWWRDDSGWWDRIRGNRQRRGLIVTEAEPGIVHITTDAFADLLKMAGFKREGAR